MPRLNREVMPSWPAVGCSSWGWLCLTKSQLGRTDSGKAHVRSPCYLVMLFVIGYDPVWVDVDEVLAYGTV